MNSEGERADVIIVGGGVIGLCLARALLQEKQIVCVIDAGPSAPSAALAAAGMLAPSFERSHGGDAKSFYELCDAGMAMWPEFAQSLEDATGHKIDFRQDGILGTAFNDAEESRLREDFETLRSLNKKVDWLSSGEARSLEPILSHKTVGALLAPEDGQVDPRLLLPALRAAFVNGGGRLIEGERVVRVNHGADGVRGVTTDRRANYEAPVVVAASGAFLGAIDLGLAAPEIIPVKGESYICDAGEQNPSRVIRSNGAYLCPKTGGRLFVGATEIVGDRSLAPREEGIAGLKAGAARAAPTVAEFPELDRWAGLRPSTPDGAPIIGRSDGMPRGLYFALGHHRNGVLLAPLTASLLRQKILTGEIDDLARDLGPDRFSN